MKRRTFLTSAALFSAATAFPISKFDSLMTPNFKMGYQLFSIRDEMAKDPIKTLKYLKSLGYQDFEIYGYDTAKGSYYGFKAKEFKTILDDLDLTISSGHYGFAPFLDQSNEALLKFVDQCIVGAKTLESDYITWPWIAPKQRTLENYKRMTDKLNLIGERVVAAGLKFAYHNHGFEFEDHQDTNGFDIIVKGTDANLVKLQLDMYWVMHSSKLTPKQIVAKNPGRITLWHIKDMDKITRDYSELGNGSINYHDVLPNPKTSGLEYYYIEQGGNFAESSWKSAADSATYFKKELQQYL